VAEDPRLVACCINGAPANPILMFERYPRQWHLAAAMMPSAARSAESLEGFWRSLAFDQSLSLPGSLLIVHGGADILVPREEQAAFLGSWKRSSMVEWPGGEHCVFNFAEERDALVCDWFAHELLCE
jgi:pimeloyl-ACP methyl ester carboxylesterase